MRGKHVLFILVIMLSMPLLATPSATYMEVAQADGLRPESGPDDLSLPSDIAYQDVKIAVYAETNTTLPAYATGGSYTDNFETVYNFFEAMGYEATELTTGQILAGLLVTADFDVLVLVDNLPRAEIANHIMDFWLGGGSVLSFNGAIGFLFYSGMLDEGFGGTFQLSPITIPGMWAYYVTENSTVAQRHPVTVDFPEDEVLVDVTGNVTIWNNQDMPTILGERLQPLLMHTSIPTVGYAFAYDDPVRGGKIVQLPGNCESLPDSIRALTLAAVDWLAPRPKARVLFDLSHEPYYGVDLWDPNVNFGERFYRWRDNLVNRSYTFDKLILGAPGFLTSDRLEKYDMLILNTPDVNFTVDEYNAIWDWVNDGGGLYVMGEWNSSTFGFGNLVINNLCAPFGLSLFLDYQYSDVTPTVTGTHPVHEAAMTLNYGGGSYVNYTGAAFPLYMEGANVAVAASTHGEGRIILTGDINLLSNLMDDYPMNRQYGINAANWITSGDADILVYADTSEGNGDPNENVYTGPVAQALCDLGVKFQLHFSMFYFDLALQEKEWNMVVVDNNNHGISSYFDELLTYLETGGKMVMATWGYSSASGTDLFAYLGYEYSGPMYPVPPQVHIWEDGHPIFHYPQNHVGAHYNATSDFGYGVEAANLTLLVNGTPLAGFDMTPGTDNASIIIGAGGRAISNAMLLTFYMDDMDDSTYPDAVELWEAEIAFLYFDRPQLSDQSNIEYEAGITGNNAQWTYTSGIPAYYELRVDGFIEETGRVINPSILVNVDGYAPGTYSFQLTVYDRAMYPVSDDFVLTVTDSVDPTIDSPADVSYVVNSTGNEIVWTVSDDYPDVYNLYIDSLLADTGVWSSGAIVVDIDGLNTGRYNFTLEIFDTSGNSVNDSVTVRVVAAGLSPVVLGVIGAGVAAAIIVVLIIWNSKRGAKPE